MIIDLICLNSRSGAAAAAASGLLQCTISHHSSQSQSGGSSTEPEKNAAVSTLMKNLIEMSGGRLYPIVVRRKAARLLAAKSALAVRADCYRRMDPLASEKLEVPEKLESGDYGKSLGQEIKRQLRVWAETNGVHLECTAEELEVCVNKIHFFWNYLSLCLVVYFISETKSKTEEVSQGEAKKVAKAKIDRCFQLDKVHHKLRCRIRSR